MPDLWYPDFKKPGKSDYVRKNIISPCPVCYGTGKRIDKITRLERDCAACCGTGVMK